MGSAPGTGDGTHRVVPLVHSANAKSCTPRRVYQPLLPADAALPAALVCPAPLPLCFGLARRRPPRPGHRKGHDEHQHRPGRAPPAHAVPLFRQRLDRQGRPHQRQRRRAHQGPREGQRGPGRRGGGGCVDAHQALPALPPVRPRRPRRCHPRLVDHLDHPPRDPA